MQEYSIEILYDIGQKRKILGNFYNPISGHYFMVGVCSDKVMSVIVVSYKFIWCDRAARLNNEPGLHKYPWNHKGIRK